jgi:hypothetical protein
MKRRDRKNAASGVSVRCAYRSSGVRSAGTVAGEVWHCGPDHVFIGEDEVGTQRRHRRDPKRAPRLINSICSSLPSKLDDKWSVDGLSRLRDRVKAHNLAGYGAAADELFRISTTEMPAIYLGRVPADRNIDDICQMIRNCARGIMQVKYNFTLIGIPRSGTAAGRGPSIRLVRVRTQNKIRL